MQQISYNSVEDITDDIRKQIGWRIQEKRIEKGITAVDLSTYLNITANQVSRIERGCAGIDIYKLIVICKILGVSADYILFGEMKEENITISKEQFEAINGLISMFGMPNGVIINDAYCDRSMTRDYDREGLNAFFATLKEEDFEVVVVRSLNEITDDIYDLEEFVNTITDMGIWLYSLEVGPVPITVSHAEDFGC